MRLTKIVSILFLSLSICGLGKAQPSIVQENTTLCYNSSATSLGCSLPSNTTAGDTVAFVVTQNLSTPATEPTSISGCGGATWIQAMQTWPFNDQYLYVAYNVGAVSCTATAVFGSSSQMTEQIFEFGGVPSNYVLGARTYSGRSTSTINFETQGNFLALAIVHIGPGGGTCNGNQAISGWTLQSNSVCNPGGGAGSSSMDTHAYTLTGAAGSFSFTPNWNNSFGINPTAILVTFRSTIPNPGRMQFTIWSSNTSQSFDGPNTAGDLLLALCGNDGNTPPTDTAGNTWIITPVLIDSDSTNFYNLYYVPSALAASTNSVTCSAGSGSHAVELFEYQGLSTIAPFGSSSDFFTQNTSISSIPAGTVQANSASVLFSVGAMMQSPSITLTPSSGFINFGAGSTSQNNISDSIGVWDESVSAGTYSNTITFSSMNTFPQAILVALESSAVTAPTIKQRARASAGAGSDGSRNAVFIGAVKVGDLILMALTNQTVGTGPGTTSDSISDTWHTFFTFGSPTVSNGYALYWTIANSNVAAGSYNATNTNAQCIAIIDFSNLTTTSQDVYSTAQNLSGAASLSSGNITTTSQDMLFAFGTLDSSSTRLDYTSQTTGWSQLGLTCGGHDAALFAGWRSQVAIGTYSNTFAWSTSAPITASIFAFKVPSLGSHPIVNVLTRLELPKEWRDSVGFLR